MLKIGIIIGSTRPGRRTPAVAQWIYDLAVKKGGAEYEIVDIADYDLPVLDEANPAVFGNYTEAHTKKWAEKVASLDGYIFVTPEYNHSISGALKNAIDFVYAEWNNKAAGFVSFGTTGGARAVEHLRGIMAEVQVADVRGHVSLNLFSDFVNFSELKPGEWHFPAADTMLTQLLAWTRAMKTLRAELAQQAKAA